MTTVYQQGQLFVLTVGSYSDYHIIGHAVVLRTFEVDKALAEWREEVNPGNAEAFYDYELSAFLSWLCTGPNAPCIELTQVAELHISDYYGSHLTFTSSNHAEPVTIDQPPAN